MTDSFPAPVEIRPGLSIGPGLPLTVFAGPCVIEDEQTCMTVASHMVEVCARLGLAYVFKASFDKANRTSVDSFRGPGLDAGLEILAAVAARFRVPVVTDVHETAQVAKVASVVDVLQIPAFLCRQTDLLLAAAESGRVVNVKKGQFLAPEDMAAVVAKVRSTGNQRLLLTERGTSFGYHNLFDATHSVQLPGGQGTSSGGRREFVPPLARAAAAVGIDGLFLETHPNPSEARSDGPNSLPLQDVEQVLRKVRDIHELGR
jgi:2-dehydro-3-deoxyphosphooctonate aldolase (KDO 8-P synthase)